jgi:hypothetical protein
MKRREVITLLGGAASWPFATPKAEHSLALPVHGLTRYDARP